MSRGGKGQLTFLMLEIRFEKPSISPCFTWKSLAGDLFCTLFTNFHSVQHFVHYLYTIEAVHYWIPWVSITSKNLVFYKGWYERLEFSLGRWSVVFYKRGAVFYKKG